MTFTMTGRLIPPTKMRTVSWDDGELTGDTFAVMALEDAAFLHEGRRIGPPECPVTWTNHLASGLLTVFLAGTVFFFGIATTGDVPTSGA